ncbi:hypothetical protein [Hymenobacter arizonensis]|uniref:hypothetical protein n=1 Tax=Hymenobacter arizonensis TaxID=1227077 RepID=UPI000B824764|nr:hypothetical protein [Hymenobacter arizonensis]
MRNLRYSAWRKETEIADLLQFHLGLMPLMDDLVDDPWARGKCAFQALQYVALGMLVLASPVGMNTEMVQRGVNNFVYPTDEDWYGVLC